jgi:parallel beta-helix repeat protein
MTQGARRPVAFMSYVRFNDQHDEGRLTQLRSRLSAEVEAQTAEQFPIFQDRNDIYWGQAWLARIESSIDDVAFLIPIITPSFFKSPACRAEVERFISREQKLNQTDLVLPIYYIDCPLFNDPAKRSNDPIAEWINKYQYTDWRDLRFESPNSTVVSKRLAELAVQIRDRLERVVNSGQSQDRPATVHDSQSPVGVTTSTSFPESLPTSTHLSKYQQAPARVDPPIIVVDPMGADGPTTISEAIKTANPGDRILVRPGYYRESLQIDKPLEIIGDGTLSEIVVSATAGPVITFRSTIGRIANLTLRQKGQAYDFAVDIAQGSLELQYCDISSQSGTCVGIRDGADPRLRGNVIHEGGQGGIAIFNNGLGTIEDNDIFGNTLASVFIYGGGNPVLRRNQIHDGQQSGVYVYNNGQGTLEDNDIFRHEHAGVATSTGGNPVVRNNRIRNCGVYAAVYVFKGGRGTFEENDLRGNAKGPWQITKKCEPNVRLIHNVS